MGPKIVQQSVEQGSAGAMKALPMLMKGAKETGKFTSTIATETCIRCRTCMSVCPHGAIRMTPEGAVSDPAFCQGCGFCAASCPTHAAQLLNFSDRQILDQAAVAFDELPEGEPKIMALLCYWCAYSGGDLAGVKGMEAPSNFRSIRIRCSSSVNLGLVMEMFRMGIDGVLVAGCPEQNRGCKKMARQIRISPITRLEGHGKIDIFLDDDGNVADAYLQVVELRGFEKFCEGRPVEELIRIMPKICGVCPGAHHMASAKAADAVFKVEIPPAARKLRELFYNAHIAHSHMLHFFALGAPDFLADFGPAKRNVLGLIEVVGKAFGLEVLKNRGYAQKIQGIIGGHPIHPAAALPGGMSQALSEENRAEIEAMGRSMVDFAQKSLEVFEEKVLGQEALRELIAGDTYYHETYYAGLVDPQGHLNFYDGKIRVVNPSGGELSCFGASEYLEHVAERVEPWTYLKFPYLKAVGWKGLTDGPESGVYRVNALARLNVASGMATPLAQAAYKKMYTFFGCKPVHHTLAFHWSRLIELLFASEEVLRLARDPEITSRDIRNVPTGKPGVGVGVVEAARGTLFHHYEADPKGIAKKVNLIVATVQNNAGMCMSVKKAAQAYIHNGKVDEGILNKVEMAFRAYDPCLACATHTLPGKMPLELRIHDRDGGVRVLTRG